MVCSMKQDGAECHVEYEEGGGAVHSAAVKKNLCFGSARQAGKSFRLFRPISRSPNDLPYRHNTTLLANSRDEIRRTPTVLTVTGI
jgi:hypothetical protein